jgi:hypothetical protein
LDLGSYPAIELTIDADSLDTEHEKRDGRLRSVDFFDVEHWSPFGTLRAPSKLIVRGRLVRDATPA